MKEICILTNHFKRSLYLTIFEESWMSFISLYNFELIYNWVCLKWTLRKHRGWLVHNCYSDITSTNNSNQNFIDDSSVSSNDMSIIVAPTKKSISSSQPSVPTRKASLPVTERVEVEIMNTHVHDFVHNSIGDPSRKSSYSYSSSSARPQSTIPGSASSKAILQRLQKTSQRGLPSTLETRSRGRPQTPTSDLTRLSSSNNPK